VKKNFIICFLFFLAAGIITAQPNGYIRCEGKNFIDGNGEIFIPRGINLGNWLNPEGYMFHFKNVNSYRLIDNSFKELLGADEVREFWKIFRDNYITKEDIRYIKSIGLNHVRVPFNFKLFLIEDHPEIYIREGFNRLDDVIKWCKEEGLYVVLDLHAAPGGQTGDNIDDSWSYPFLFENEEAQKTTIDLWEKIASRYKNEKIILGYDLLNEPIPHYYENKEELNPLLEPLYRKITAAIRRVDNNHIIFLGGAQWNTNFKVFGPPFEKNIAYTFHKYWMPPEQKEIQEYVDFRDKYNVPLYMGESGENDDAWINTFRLLLEKNQIGWCFWPYKKMESTRGMISFTQTEEWKQVVIYAETSKNNFEEVRKLKPPREVVRKGFADLLNNILFKNCTINTGYINALGLQ